MNSIGRVFASLSTPGGGGAGQRWGSTEGPQIRDINGPLGGAALRTPLSPIPARFYPHFASGGALLACCLPIPPLPLREQLWEPASGPPQGLGDEACGGRLQFSSASSQGRNASLCGPRRQPAQSCFWAISMPWTRLYRRSLVIWRGEAMERGEVWTERWRRRRNAAGDLLAMKQSLSSPPRAHRPSRFYGMRRYQSSVDPPPPVTI